MSDMRQLWQDQAVENTSMSAEEVRSALAQLNKVERRRSWVGVLFCLIFLGALAVLLTRAAVTPIARGCEWVFALGAGFFFLQAIAGLRQAPGKQITQAEPQACATFYKSILEQQRKFYRLSTLWVPLLISGCLLPVILWAPPLRVIMIALWAMLVPFWIHESMGIVRRSERELQQLN